MQRIKDLQLIMLNNQKYLRIIELKNILLSKDHLTAFLIKLQDITNLTVLIMDYQVLY